MQKEYVNKIVGIKDPYTGKIDVVSEEQTLRDIKRLKMEKLERFGLTEDLRNDLEKAIEAIRKDT